MADEQLSFEPVDHQPDFEDVPGVGVVPTQVPPTAAAIGKSAADWALAPGNVVRGQQPTTPGMWSDEDEALRQANERGENVWGPQTALGMVGGSAPAAEEGAVLGSGAIKAFHGSPHDFEKFDLSKIGTGQGAASYGHGLYFAENPEVAQSYREELAGREWELPQQHDTPANRGMMKDIIGETGGATPEEALDIYTRAAQRELKNLDYAKWDSNRDNIQKAADRYSNIANWIAEKQPTLKNTGKMYEVNINADPDHFLDWDKPISQQSQHVQEALASNPYSKLIAEAPPMVWKDLTYPRAWQHLALDSRKGSSHAEIFQSPDGYSVMADGDRGIFKTLDEAKKVAEDYAQKAYEGGWKNTTGKDLYEHLRYTVPANERGTINYGEIMKSLRDAGIPGIKYLDQGSRNQISREELAREISDYKNAMLGASPERKAQLQPYLDSYLQKHANWKPPTYNYVVHDDKIIDILKKYGMAGLIGAGAHHFQTTPADEEPQFAQGGAVRGEQEAFSSTGANHATSMSGSAFARGGSIDATHDVVSGADSTSRKVEVDRHIPAKFRKYLAAHETAEAQGMKEGMSYDKAHSKRGIPAERKAVKADGLDWHKYSEEIAGYLSHIEHEKVSKPPPKGEHVDPKSAIERAKGGRVVAANIDKSPTGAQKAAGNYKKDHVHIHGLDISIENAKGSTRSGISNKGTKWTSVLPAHYGYLRGTTGSDGDHLDVYLGPHLRSPKVWIIDQVDPDTTGFDEHKAFLGFGSKAQVVKTYFQAFSDGKAMERLGAIHQLSIEDFKTWLKRGDTTQSLKTGSITPQKTGKITRSAFLYLPPKPPKNQFAQCNSCSLFTGTGCLIHSKTVRVTPTMSCGLYIHGKPQLNARGQEKAVVTPEQSGLINTKVRCENCHYTSGNTGNEGCGLFRMLNQRQPEDFDLDPEIDRHGCCNAFRTRE